MPWGTPLAAEEEFFKGSLHRKGVINLFNSSSLEEAVLIAYVGEAVEGVAGAGACVELWRTAHWVRYHFPGELWINVLCVSRAPLWKQGNVITPLFNLGQVSTSSVTSQGSDFLKWTVWFTFSKRGSKQKDVKQLLSPWGHIDPLLFCDTSSLASKTKAKSTVLCL